MLHSFYGLMAFLSSSVLYVLKVTILFCISSHGVTLQIKNKCMKIQHRHKHVFSRRWVVFLLSTLAELLYFLLVDCTSNGTGVAVGVQSDVRAV